MSVGEETLHLGNRDAFQVGFGSGSFCRRFIGLKRLGIEGIYTSNEKEYGCRLGDLRVHPVADLLKVVRSGCKVQVILFSSFGGEVRELFSPFSNVDVLTTEDWMAGLWQGVFGRFASSSEPKKDLTEILFLLCINSEIEPSFLLEVLGIKVGSNSRLLNEGYRKLLEPHRKILKGTDLLMSGGILPSIFCFRRHLRKTKDFFVAGDFKKFSLQITACAVRKQNILRAQRIRQSEIAVYLGRFKVNGLTTAVRNLFLQLQASLHEAGISKILFIVSGTDLPEIDLMVKEYFGEFNFEFEIIILEDRIPESLRESIKRNFSSSDPTSFDSTADLAVKAYQFLFPLGSPRVILNRTGYGLLASIIFAIGRPPQVEAFIWAPNHMLYEWVFRFPNLKWLFATYPLYSKVVFVSSSSFRDNTRLFSWIGLPSNKLLVLKNFLPTIPVDQCSSNPSRSHLKDQALKLLWVGRFSPEKNPWLIIEAAKKLWHSGFDISLTLIGGGSLLGPCKALAFAAKKDIPITFLGEVRSFDPSYYKHFDAVVNTSIYEGLPNTFYEAWVNEVPYFAPKRRWGFEIKKLAPDFVGLYSPNLDGLVSLLVRESSRARKPVALARRDAGHSIQSPLEDYLRLLH